MAHSINLNSAGGSAYLRTGSARVPTVTTPTLWQSIVSGLTMLGTRLAEERRVRRSIAELEQLDDHMLRDIGISGRGQIASVVRHGRRGRTELG